MIPAHLIHGDRRHGVTRLAIELADALGAPICRRDEVSVTPVHVHFTDHLYGATPHEAATWIIDNCPEYSLTLHDVPQPSDGPGRYERRTAAYKLLVDRALMVVVNSDHEASLLVESGIVTDTTAVKVIPLPIDALTTGTGTLQLDAMVGVLGFVYPGKGHMEALLAAADTGLGFAVLGEASAGHKELVDDLERTADQLGVRYLSTGYIAEEDLGSVLNSVAVPVAFHRNPSASGSMGSWLAAGRRPLVRDNRYSREMLRRFPGAVNIVDDPRNLSQTVARAAVDPQWTRFTIPLSYNIFDAAKMYHQLWLHTVNTRAKVSSAQTHQPKESTPQTTASGNQWRVVTPARTTPLSIDSQQGQLSTNTTAQKKPVWTVPGNQWDLLELNDTETATQPDYTVSVIIPYYNSPRLLRKQIVALEAQTFPRERLELVVADDGSATSPVVDTVLESTIVSQPDLGFRAAAARNLGAHAAHGDVLLFLDGDTIPTADYVAKLSKLPARAPEAVVVGRRKHIDSNGFRLNDPQWLADGYRSTHNLLHADDRSYRYIISAVMGCSKQFFTEVDGFDDTFVGYGGEDWEFAWRAWNSGALLAYIPGAVAHHVGSDWGARSAQDSDVRYDIKNAETIKVARTVTEPHARGHGLRWKIPDILVRFESGSPASRLICEQSLAAHHDVLVVDEWPANAAASRLHVTVHHPFTTHSNVIDRIATTMTNRNSGRHTVINDSQALLTIVTTRSIRRHRRWSVDDLFAVTCDESAEITPLNEPVSLERAWAGW